MNYDTRDMVDCVTEAAYEHPIPLALAGIGLGWLLVASMRSSKPDLDQSEYSDYVDPLSDNPVYDMHGESSGGSSGLKARAQGAYNSVRDAASRMTNGAAESSSGLGEAARRRAESARHEAERLAAAARRRARGAGRTFSEAVEERPLLLAAIGIVIGSTLGAALPRTRREREWVGETAADVRHRAESFAREQWDRGERVVQSAAEAARAEAERQGLTPEGLRQKAADVVDAGKEAARSEMHQDQDTETNKDQDKPVY